MTSPAPRHWSREETQTLISRLELLPELWNITSKAYKNKNARVQAVSSLAKLFNTDKAEITRKLHNLRTQFNNEMRKVKNKKSEGELYTSSWHFFDALKFMTPSTSNEDNVEAVDNLIAHETSNIPLMVEITTPSDLQPPPSKRKTLSTIENEVLDKVLLLLNQEKDDEQIFGNFVASSLRCLKSRQLKGLMKRKIQKAILEVEEMEAEASSSYTNCPSSQASIDPLGETMLEY